jgi:Polyketide cyclase / dehydrase and lipid transport
MQTLFVVVVLLVVLWFAARKLKAGYTVERSLRVRTTPMAAFEALRDFRRWKDWSPWLIHDPACELVFDRPEDIGGSYTWKSALIGEGRVTHTAQQPGESLAMDLVFIKPFQSQAKVHFALRPDGEGHTRVTWTMSSQLPFFMRPWLAMFTRMIGMDFELGLLRLSGLLDPQAEVPRITFDGPVQREAMTLVTEPYSGPLAGIGQAMDAGYQRLRERVGAAQIGAPLAVYDKTDMKRGTTVCDMALPVADGSALQPQRRLGGGRHYRVTLHGHYRFLPLAWHNAFGHVRMEKLKPQMQRPCLEVYPNDPKGEPDSNRWVTEIYIPLP